ncbi:hypothetical protein HPP92_021787 [Vanilla planifolia]|uniref:Uncharacterized protein n=1 Tax=Vanilla planifolia TaxID=51239 RepID=A0A835PZI5_VANPL|nr:hypothetical protein HPP92_021787 [Vanilla planifolia]
MADISGQVFDRREDQEVTDGGSGGRWAAGWPGVAGPGLKVVIRWCVEEKRLRAGSRNGGRSLSGRRERHFRVWVVAERRTAQCKVNSELQMVNLSTNIKRNLIKLSQHDN